MKLLSLLFTVTSAFLLFACSVIDEELEPSPVYGEALNEQSEEAILSAANQAGALLSGNLHGKRRERKVDSSSPINYITRVNVDNEYSLKIDTLLYILNYESEGGYVIMMKNSPKDYFPIAMIEQGSYDPSRIALIPGFSDFMSRAEDYAYKRLIEGDNVSAKITNRTRKIGINPELRRQIIIDDTINRINIPPKISVEWGQTGVYGAECPNGICGCSNTALAQALTYFQHPSSILLTYEGSGNGMQSLDWSDINQHVSTNNTAASTSSRIAIGKLCRQLGEMSGSNYGAESTGTPMTGTWSTVGTLGLSKSDITAFPDELPYFTLSGNRIILMVGSRLTALGEEVAHMWVVDGVQGWSVRHRIWSVGLHDSYLIDDVTEHQYYNHVNWGWDGYGNGLFLHAVYYSIFDSTYDDLYYFYIYR